MSMTNRERVGKALDLLQAGLSPFVEREFRAAFVEKAADELARYLGEDRINTKKPVLKWDSSALLKVMWEAWNEVFKHTLGFSERSLVSELRDHRNRWAHQQNFTSDDAYRAIDSAGRLLAAVSAPQIEEIEKMKMELLRLRFDEQVRGEMRKTSAVPVDSIATGSLKPWREIITPHADVASGKYQQAEFAADLWQVHLGEGSNEYKDPAEFYRRTFLTDSLKQLLAGALARLSGRGGDPVVQLQTNFGGGKTHSMLALYHLFSGTPLADLSGMEQVIQSSGISTVPKAKRVVLVGNRISPGNPDTKPDGTQIRTLWGELAWQLGGKKAFEKVRADDEKATSPGDTLRTLLIEYGPTLILIDEWVAYARQLHDQSDLPGGSFDTQFTFAQVLTESVKLAGNCLVVISLPASDTGSSPHAQANDVEVGGQRGREALDRLRNVVGRIESSWRPASAEEGFEIVRRRLFEPMTDPGQFKDRDVIARAFADFYRTQHQEFPPECRDADYEKRIKAAFPIHPEIFDRLYTDWSTLLKFQRTRGVLRLMAAVIHSLWEKGDKSPLILPANVPIDDPRVQFELTRYLSDNWAPVIEKDVDGPDSQPLRLDGEIPNLGKYAACRRVARTIYLGSAPTVTAAHRGIEDRRVKLGCVMPGESPAVFEDALRRLAATARYLYQDGPHYWYSTQPTVTKIAEDRAEQLKRDPDKVTQEIDKRLRDDLKKPGDFSRVHPMPHTSQDVPDTLEARLVVLDPDHPYSKEPGNQAELRAKEILETRGNTPRLFRNTLVFLAADSTRLQDLEIAIRLFLAWESIVAEKESLDLSPHQVKQAETQMASADSTVKARLPETYQWLLVPVQQSPYSPVEWQTSRLTGQDALAVRASRKLRHDDLLAVSHAPTLLRLQLDRIPLWRDNRIAVKQVVENYARFPYLPRLAEPQILLRSIQDGLSLITWESDAFAYADSYDEGTGRYRGLRIGGEHVSLTSDFPGLLVKPEVAIRQLEQERKPAETVEPYSSDLPPGEVKPTSEKPRPEGEPPSASRPRRYHGVVELDPDRVGRDASRIADEIISHLSTLPNAKIQVTLEIQAEIPDGASENVIRTVTENARTLKFTSQGFETE
jgi:predicted AAA+ superfamily ATPase